MSLATGKQISRRRWTELPITEEIIERVHTITLMEATYDDNVPDFQFSWGVNDPIDDPEDPDEQGNNVFVAEDDEDDVMIHIVDADHIGDEPKEAGAFDTQEIGAFTAQENQEDEAFDAQEVGAFDAQEIGAFTAQEEGANDALFEEANDANENVTEAHGREEEIVLETVNDMEEDNTVNGMEGEIVETKHPQHYNLQGNKIDYAYKFAFTQLTDIEYSNGFAQSRGCYRFLF
jgi:hypothetical protein